MPRHRTPELLGPEAYVQAARAPGGNLKDKFKNDPESLALMLGLKLPEKPVQRMIRLGVITEEQAIERFGPQYPGLRELVLEVCNLSVRSAVAVGPRGGGKAISLKTPLPTPDGWVTMGEIQEGQTLYDRDGEPCTVTRVFEVDPQPESYDVCFNDGTSIRACADHKWITETTNERAANLMHYKRSLRADGWHGQWKGHREGVRTTKEILDTLRTGPRGDLNHGVTNSLPVNFPRRKFLVEPYVLGFWLGDGATGANTVAVNASDLDVVRRIERRGTKIGTVRKIEDSHCYVAGLLKFTTRLRELGVLNNKHVPREYLRGSVSQRRWLLAGLMDSDGTCRNYNGNCQFDNMNEQISDAVYELVVSLGWKATRYKKAAKFNGVDYGTSYGVSFRPTEQVFKCKRKARTLEKFLDVSQQSRHERRMITDVRPIPPEPMRCISVDSPSRTYLCGEQMVPTHNSQGVSFIEFFLWIIKDFDALNLGGSELQAANVYDYLVAYVESHREFSNLIKGEMRTTESKTKENNWIKVLTASQKSVRSPHAGGVRNVNGRRVERGGLLVIDEEAEAEPEIVNAALPTINTARPSVNVRSSTFHNEGGTFSEVVDNAEEMGYTLHRWDVFDVCAGCNCPGDKCESPEPCFREDHYENVVDPETGAVERKVKHKAYCGGRAKYAQGWVPMEEIETLWRRTRRNHDKFEIEQMGSRPGSKGYVIKDRTKFRSNITPKTATNLITENHWEGFPGSICVDWGSIAAGVELWMAVPGDKHLLVYAELVEDAGLTQITSKIAEIYNLYRNIVSIQEIAADIGGGGNYLNPYMREKGYEVRDVVFNDQKESAVAAWNIYNEAEKTIIPEEFVEFKKQVKNWKRKNGRINKGNDHLCDAAICYFAKFINELGVSGIRVPPTTFSAIPSGKAIGLVPGRENPGDDTRMSRAYSPSQHQFRVPVAIALGRRR